MKHLTLAPFLFLFGLGIPALLSCDKKPGAAAGIQTSSDPTEARKARLGALVKEAFDIMKRAQTDPALRQDPATRQRMEQLGKEGEALAKELSGGDKAKEEVLLDEVIKKYVPEGYDDYRRAQAERKKMEATAKLRNIQTALHQYKLQNGKFPEGLATLVKPEGNQLPYLMGEDHIKDGWGNPMVYQIKNGSEFTIKSIGPDGKEGTADDIELK